MSERRKFAVQTAGMREEGRLPFDIVTSSSRRYLVVDTRQRATIKRTDNWKVAYRLRVQEPLRLVIVDTATGGLRY